MPEGPELKFLSIFLKKYILNEKILNITALSKKKVYLPSVSKIIDVQSKGKLLWIQTQDYYIHIHLGITGWIYINEKPDYTKYIIETSKNIVYVDSMRKFTKLQVYTEKTHLAKLKKLNGDILTSDFNIQYLINTLQSTNTIIASFLLKQNKFAGLGSRRKLCFQATIPSREGNYIKNEALYLAKINPKIKTNNIKLNQIKKLYKAIRYVAFSVLIGFIKDNNLKLSEEERKLIPKTLQIPYKYRVYGKTKDPKGNKIKKEKIGGRWTYYSKHNM